MLSSMCRSARVVLSLTAALMLSAGTCDKVHSLKREAPLSLWPDPACIEGALRAAPVLGEVWTRSPHPSPDDPRRTIHEFSIRHGGMDVAMWLDTDAAHRQMNIELYWSRLHRPPSDDELKQINVLMDRIEERISGCRGVPLPSAYRRS